MWWTFFPDMLWEMFETMFFHWSQPLQDLGLFFSEEKEASESQVPSADGKNPLPLLLGCQMLSQFFDFFLV